MSTPNIHAETVHGFGEEWSAFDQTALSPAELERYFRLYFSIFPFDELPPDAEGFDLGCGSGRWAELVAKQVGTLHCIEPSPKALAVARRRLEGLPNVICHQAQADAIPLDDGSQDFGYSLGVLHHIPDTEAAMRDCVRKLKPGAPFLVYLYYSLENRPPAFRALWRASDLVRNVVSRLPFGVRKGVTSVLAATVYLPLARASRLAEKTGADVSNIPLSSYRHSTLYTMRTDALDRFGTRLEQRFTRAEVQQMMTRCGLDQIVFQDSVPYWVACGRKRHDAGSLPR